MRLLGAIATLILAAGSLTTADAWGAKGHTMSGRVAAQALPADMPIFFRASSEQLAYLLPEPDRWRGEAWGGHRGPRQELTNDTAANHNIRMELLDGIQFPVTRNEFIVMMVERGIVPRDEVNMHKVGLVFYAIVEEMQRLTVEFRLWREQQEAASLDGIALKQIQENAIFSAGVLGHWITDSGQPLHVTVHSDDWDQRFPNPKHYVTKDIHGRFEGEYVNRAIEEADIREHMTPLRMLGDWRAEAESHIRRSLSHFEEVYELDGRGAFGSGNEPKDAKDFTATRLAEGASLLRDAWYACWLKSADELLDSPVRVVGQNEKTALDLLKRVKRVETASVSGGMRLVGIGERRDGVAGRHWQLFVDNAPVNELPDHYRPANGQTIEWRFIH